jgi:antitoxin VapB
MATTKTSAGPLTAVKTAKLFKNGRSQAVRLPKEFRFEGTEVEIWRDPETGKILLSEFAGFAADFPADRRALVARSSWQELFAAWDVLGSADDEEMVRSATPPVERDFF